MKTKPINQQPSGPLELVHMDRNHIASFDGAALATIAPNGDAQRAVPLLLSAYSSFDRAARALNVDAAELAESLDLVALIQGAQDLLAYLEEQEAGKHLVHPFAPRVMPLRAQLSKLPKGNT